MREGRSGARAFLFSATPWSNLDNLLRSKQTLDGTEGLSSANYATVELNKQLRKQAEIDEKAAQWTALQTQRVQAKANGGALSETDEGKWASLSFWLGGKYLLP
jgi:hypothetical protein